MAIESSEPRIRSNSFAGVMKVPLLRRFVYLGLILLISAGSPAHGQQNIIGLDVLGRAGVYSVNFERSQSRIGVGAGMAVWSIDREHALIVPLYVSMTPVGKTSSLYIAGGGTIGVSNLTLIGPSRPYSTAVVGTITGGYQHRSAGGLLIRPTVTYFFDRSSSFCCWPGIMIGHSF